MSTEKLNVINSIILWSGDQQPMNKQACANAIGVS